jgi:hypothetical protein
LRDRIGKTAASTAIGVLVEESLIPPPRSLYDVPTFPVSIPDYPSQKIEDMCILRAQSEGVDVARDRLLSVRGALARVPNEIVQRLLNRCLSIEVRLPVAFKS